MCRLSRYIYFFIYKRYIICFEWSRPQRMNHTLKTFMFEKDALNIEMFLFMNDALDALNAFVHIGQFGCFYLQSIYYISKIFISTKDALDVAMLLSNDTSNASKVLIHKEHFKCFCSRRTHHVSNILMSMKYLLDIRCFYPW